MTDKIKKTKLTPLPKLELAAECLKILSHPHRLRIIQMLLQGRYTVGELAESCGIPSHMASEHLDRKDLDLFFLTDSVDEAYDYITSSLNSK